MVLELIMKIRKIHIKNYKMFNDVRLDFTNNNGETLDTIVIAGINGSGKTSLIQLLEKLFSENLNIFKVGMPLRKYEAENNALICDEVELELDISNDEKSDLISLAHKNRYEIIPALKTEEQYIKLLYKLEKTEKGFVICQNDFAFFGILPENDLKNLFKVLSFSAVHGNKLSSSDDMNSDGIVFPIDIFFYQKTVETHIVKLVQEKVLENRDLITKEVIEQAIDDINKLLEGVSLNTKLVDIDSQQPIFKSFNDSKILSNELSSGEKQLYYKAILFDKKIKKRLNALMPKIKAFILGV
jgi:predicted ATP-binding protein involved in virulence